MILGFAFVRSSPSSTSLRSLSLVPNDFHNKVPQLIALSSVCFDFTKFLLLPPSQVTSKVNSQHFHSCWGATLCPQFGWMSCRICTSTWFSGGFIIDNFEFEYFYGQLAATAAARLYYVIRRSTPSPTSSFCSGGLARGNWPLRRASSVPQGNEPFLSRTN